MPAHHAWAWLVALLCLLLLVGMATFTPTDTSLAQGSSQYRLSWNVIAGGGGASHSSQYALSGTTGQTAPGAATSPYYRLGSGFWYGFGMRAVPGYKLYLPSILKQRS